MIARLGIVAAFFVALASSQNLLQGEAARRVNRAFDESAKPERLDCWLETFSPNLDFFFQFESTYVLGCPLRQFDGLPSQVRTVLRVTPDSGEPVILGTVYNLPALSPELRERMHVETLKSAAEASGGFVIGEGEFKVELLAIDNRGRVFRRHWKVNAKRTHEERHVALTVAPGSVAPLAGAFWTGEHAATRHGQVTLLLNAAPVNPFAPKLRAWDRAFLLGSLTSTLRQLHYDSVRLIAFNLDQQREIFHTDHFDGESMPALADAMQKMELGVVSYTTLRQTGGWVDLLRSLTREERTRQDASDAVIFLGPWTRRDADAAAFALDGSCPKKPLFFDIVYYRPVQRGREFADGIQRLTGKQDGVSYRIHSPGELGQALQKLNGELQRSSSPAETSLIR